MNANEQIDRLKDSLRQTRKAIIGRGGEISETAGFKDVADAVFHIPADNAITTMTVNGFYFDVPDNATKYAYIAAFGGNTYRLENGYYDEDVGEYVEAWELLTEYPRSIYFSGLDEETGDDLHSELIIPEEILNLPDFGEGIDHTHYNKVDLVKNKYARVIDTLVLNGGEVWKANFGDGRSSEYFFCDYCPTDIYESDVVICDKYDSVQFSGGGNEVGIWAANSSRGVFSIRIRPRSDMTGYTFAQWKADLAESPITVKVARQVPIETDLPVRINPLLRVWGGKGYIESAPTTGETFPVEVILQTYTQ